MQIICYSIFFIYIYTIHVFVLSHNSIHHIKKRKIFYKYLSIHNQNLVYKTQVIINWQKRTTLSTVRLGDSLIQIQTSVTLWKREWQVSNMLSHTHEGGLYLLNTAYQLIHRINELAFEVAAKLLFLSDTRWLPITIFGKKKKAKKSRYKILWSVDLPKY